MLKNEMAFYNRDNAMKVAQILLEEKYIVMLSKEEDLTIVNFEFSWDCDRNDVVFMNKDEYYEEFDKFREEILNDNR